MALKRSLLVGLAALLLAAPAAEARSPFHLVARGSSVTTDGERYALLWNRDGQAYRVIDDELKRSFDLPPAPAGCSLSSGRFDLVASGSVLWDCPSVANGISVSRPLLQDLGTGDFRPVPGWDAYLRWFDQQYATGWVGQGPWPQGIGSHWLRGSILCYHCLPEYSYLDWHTGRFIAHLDETATTIPDLDSPDLEVPICPPLRRPRYQDPLGSSFYFGDSDYEPPWYLRSAGRRYVSLYRCGHRKPLRIHRCSALWNCSPQLGGGYLTWSDPSWTGVVPTIKVFRLADRRRVVIGKLRKARVVQHTGNDVYVTTASDRVYAAPLPGRRP
jgi:hypothetical protein